MSKEDSIVIFNANEDMSWWSIRLSDYNDRFREDFKTTIPPEERSWDPVNKVWSFAHKWKNWVCNLAQKCFPGSEIVEEEY